MTKHPKVSVITPSYNQAQFIRMTIDSVLSQNYPNLEYIVMDGGSTDGTVEILRSYGKRIKWVSKKDKGQSDAINRGLKMATGEIVSYLNSDDLYQKECLLEVSNFFQKNPQYYFLSGKCDVIDEKGNSIDNFITLYKNFFLKHLSKKDVLSILNYISQPATFWRKEVISKIGFFDTKLNYAMDYDYWLRMIKIYKLGFIDRYLASYRIHRNSKSGANFSGLLAEGYQVSKNQTGVILGSIHRVHDYFTLLGYKIMRHNL